MAVAANYIVASDGKNKVKNGFTVQCPAPANIATNWAPVLTFMVDLVGSPWMSSSLRCASQPTSGNQLVYRGL